MSRSQESLSNIRSALIKELDDGNQATTRDLAHCQPNIPHLLKDALSRHDTASITTSGSLLSLADQHINCTPFQLVQKCWLRLYTDATLVYIICSLEEVASLSNENRKELIRMIDMAIIVAGAVGEGRLERLLCLIKLLQECYPPVILNVGSEPPRKRIRAETPDLLYSSHSILEVPASLSMSAYLKHHTHHPIILRDYACQDSPTCPRWNALELWKDVDYLRSVAGPGRVVPVEIGHAYDEAGWTQKILSFEEFLQRSGFDSATRPVVGKEPMFLAQYGLFRQFPQFERDFSLPDFVFAAPTPPDSYPDYQSPPDTITNVWVGSGSNEIVSPPHTDPYYNCYVQVTGRKRVWLAPPQVSDMATYSGTTNDGSAAAQLYMDNTSQIPIFKTSRGELEALFPNFAIKVLPLSQEAVLSPGDMMILPPGWWHAMTGEGQEPVWSVSMWF